MSALVQRPLEPSCPAAQASVSEAQPKPPLGHCPKAMAEVGFEIALPVPCCRMGEPSDDSYSIQV